MRWPVAGRLIAAVLVVSTTSPASAQRPTPTPGFTAPRTDPGPVPIRRVPYFHATSVIPPGSTFTTVPSRFVSERSRILLSVDGTHWPGRHTAHQGAKVIMRRDGLFRVGTLDGRPAPPMGLPFSYIVFDGNEAPFAVGRATIAAGQTRVSVDASAVRAASVVILTVDQSGHDVRSAVPGLKVASKADGRFVASTLDNSAAPTDLHFSYLATTDASCPGASPAASPSPAPAKGPTPGRLQPQAERPFEVAGCASVIRRDRSSTIVGRRGVSLPAAVFATVDATPLGADPPLPGVWVRSHGSGLFTVATQDLSAAARDVPFSFLVVPPPARWEELGPTGRSGIVWAVAIEPRDPRRRTWYAATTSGLWKTGDGGDTWTRPRDGISPVRVLDLALPPETGHLFAMDDEGRIFRSTNQARTFTEVVPSAPIDVTLRALGTFLEAGPSGELFVCSPSGLWRLPPDGRQWLRDDPPDAADCTDVEPFREPSGGATLYAAYRDAGVFERPAGSPGAWRRIKRHEPTFSPAVAGELREPSATRPRRVPIRVGVHADKVVLNYECNVFVAARTALAGADPERAWSRRFRDGKPLVCDATQGGYNQVVEIAPGRPDRYVIAGKAGFITHDDGRTWHALLNFKGGPFGQGDFHEVDYFDDDTMLVAIDQGVRLLRDAGATTLDALTLGRFTDGPPVTEFYNLTVSRADRFGRVGAAGAVQDHGGIGIIGRPTGFGCCAGEFGFVAVAPLPVHPDEATSSFRLYGTTRPPGDDEPGYRRFKACDFVSPGPDTPPPSDREDGYYPREPDDCGFFDFAQTEQIVAAAISSETVDSVLVGSSTGKVFRAVRGSSPLRYEQVAAGPGRPVTRIAFLAHDVAMVAHAGGTLTRIDDPFGAARAADVRIASGDPNLVFPQIVQIDAIASRYGDPSEIYVADRFSVYATSDAGRTWRAAFNDPDFRSVAAIAVDPDHPVVYVAAGAAANPVVPPKVWRSATPARQDTWTDVGQGLPEGTQLTGIGVAPNRAVYLSTRGYGLWWRRDVVTEAPNSGVNEPSSGSGAAGAAQRFVTRCSYPGGWRKIRTIEFTLARGDGPEAGTPALRALFDQDAGVFRVEQPDGTWVEGRPGSQDVLRGAAAGLRMAGTSFGEAGGADVPTVEVVWEVAFDRAAAGDLQQYLRVTDDAGDATSWDRVGDWTVTDPVLAATRAAVGLAGAVLLALGVAVPVRRRRRRLAAA